MQHAIEASARVRLQPPPPTLMRIVNPMVRQVLRTRLLGGRMRMQALLEFDGRRTGRRIRVPVCLHEVDGDAMVFTKRPWRLNFVGGAPLIVTHRGRARQATAHLLDGTPEEVGVALRAAIDNGATPFQLGLRLQRGYQPTAADLSKLPLGLIRISFAE